MPGWRLIIDGRLPGRENMAIDAELLQRAADPGFVPVLRFYDWGRPTITIGYGQKRADIDFDRCKADGLDFAVRPTGGRAVLHWNEITYSVVLPVGHPICRLNILESYRVISSALVTGFELLGIKAELARGAPGGYRNPSCFSSASKYEIVVGGKKLVGSAQRRKKGAILQQGSIPVGPEYRKLGKYLKNQPTEAELAGKSTCLSECLDVIPERSGTIEALLRGFEIELGIEFS